MDSTDSTRLNIHHRFTIEQVKRILVTISREDLEQFTIDLFKSHLELQNAFKDYFMKKEFSDFPSRSNPTIQD